MELSKNNKTYAPKSLLLESPMFQFLFSPLPSCCSPLYSFSSVLPLQPTPLSLGDTLQAPIQTAFLAPWCFRAVFFNVLNNHSGWQTNAENTGAILTSEMRTTVIFPSATALLSVQSHKTRLQLPVAKTAPTVLIPCSHRRTRMYRASLSSGTLPWHGAFSAVAICPGLLMLLLGPVYGGLPRTPSPSSSSCPLWV